MKRVGTISSAAGLIYLGVWMILRKSDPGLASEMFKWWPAIIILIGVEVLVYSSIKREGERVGFNGLIIPVVLILLFINIFQGVYYGITKNWNIDFGRGISINKMIDDFKDMDLDRYKSINSSKVIPASGKVFDFSADNADLTFKKSPDNNIRIDAKIYVEKFSSMNSYSIEAVKGNGGVSVNIRELEIKRVTADIYVPDGMDINLVSDNMRLKNQDELIQTAFNIKCDNSSITIDNVKSFINECDNTSMDITDVKAVRIKGDSGLIRLNGNVEDIDVKLQNGTVDADNEIGNKVDIGVDNGKVTVRNKVSRNVTINVNDGMATYRTGDKNVEAVIDIDSGICNFNGERRVNTGITRTLGSGEGKVKISVDNGTASFSSQE